MRLSKTQNFIEETKNEFQQYEEEQITDKKATEIQNNLFGVIGLILEWSMAFLQEGKKWLQRLQQLISAKNKLKDIDLLLNDEQHSDRYSNIDEKYKYLK